MTSALCVALLVVSAAKIPGADDPAMITALDLLAEDPPIMEVQKAALDYFNVSQGDLTSYRLAARLRALLPALGGTFAQDDTKFTRESTDRAAFVFDPNNPQITDASSGVARTYLATVTWELGSLVFDPSQLETYALVGIHEDLVKEVTRLYYTRQHNILALALEPPASTRAKVALILRTREIEAMLDALTGGAWSRLSKR